jgi:pimeloyl-ACP methyl ester carboxylesterase
MTAAKPTRSRHDLLLQLGTTFVTISVLVFEPPRPRGTVFCLHEFAGNAEDFESLGRFLVGNGYRVVCPDFPGRGLSASLTDPTQYAGSTMLSVLMQVMQVLAVRRIFLLGTGWGGFIAALLTYRMRFDLAGLVLANLEPLWPPKQDPLFLEIAQGIVTFPDRSTAEFAVRNSVEFLGCRPRTIEQKLHSRLREGGAGYRLNYDPAIVTSLERLNKRRLHVGRLLAKLGCPLLYLRGEPLGGEHGDALNGILASNGGALAGGMAPLGRVHFDTSSQLFLLLGFLSTRRYPLAG